MPMPGLVMVNPMEVNTLRNLAIEVHDDGTFTVDIDEGNVM